MKKLLDIKKVPLLFSSLCLALIALMAFQIHWLFSSQCLIEEQFDQKVKLAIGNSLADFNANHEVNFSASDLQNSGNPADIRYLPIDERFIGLGDQAEFEENLAGYMACYGIEEKYKVGLYREACAISEGTYCCSLGKVAGCTADYMLGVSFTSRTAYTMDKMSPMILSSILVFGLLASISFVLLWSLIKQKRITESNIDFFNNTAHELKTPLTNISLALKLMRQKIPGLSDDKYAGIIQMESSKLASQIERVLFLSKMESGDYKIEREEVDIGKVLHDVRDRLALLAKEKKGSIELKIEDENLRVMGDSYHLSNVFCNLLDNALKYCDRDPIIEIVVREENGHVVVLITDNGIGISPQDQNHIFEKFQRVTTGNVVRAKGFGIGLSYVKTVIEMHKGWVKVESEVNKGSRFQLLIPNA